MIARVYRDDLGHDRLEVPWATLLAPLVPRLPDPDRALAVAIAGSGAAVRYLVDALVHPPCAGRFTVSVMGDARRPVWLAQHAYRSVRYHPGATSLAHDPASALVLTDRSGPRAPQTVWSDTIQPLEALLAAGLARPARVLVLGELERETPHSASRATEALEAEKLRLVEALVRCGVWAALVQAAPRYGPLDPGGLAFLLHRVALGHVLACPADPAAPLRFVHHADLARAWIALLVQGGAPPATALAWSAPAVRADAVFTALARRAGPGWFLGTRSPWFELLGLGYRNDPALPPELARLASSLREWLDGAAARLAGSAPRPSEAAQLLEDLCAPRRARIPSVGDLTALDPPEALAGLAELDGPEAADGPPDDAPVDPAEERAARVDALARELAPRSDVADPSRRAVQVALPTGPWTIDVASLRLLGRALERHAWAGAGEEGLLAALAHRLPTGLALARGALARLVRALAPDRREASAGKPAGERQGSVARASEALRAAAIDDAWALAERLVGRHAGLLALLPERRVGLVVELDGGHVGVVLALGPGRVDVSFPRRLVDQAGPDVPLERRVAELRHGARLDLALGAPLARIVGDLVQGTLPASVLTLAPGWVVAGSTVHFPLLARALLGPASTRAPRDSATAASTVLFADSRGRISVGLARRGGRQGAIGPEELELIERLRVELAGGSLDELARLLTRVEPQAGVVRAIRIASARRLLAEVLRPSPLGRIRALLERRRAAAAGGPGTGA